MLVLQRKAGEQIMIGEDIVVTVVEIRGDKIRLGVTAPESVTVDRREVRDRIAVEGRRRDGHHELGGES